jgi:hypothetical protein
VKVFPFPIAKNRFQPGVEKQLALTVHLNGSGLSISEKELSHPCRIGVMLVVPFFFLSCGGYVVVKYVMVSQYEFVD